MSKPTPVLSKVLVAAGLFVVLTIAGCSGRATTGTINNPGGPTAKESVPPEGIRRSYVKGRGPGASRAAVRVNRFAWRAALDSLSFMPLRTSDPYGGAIATDWYTPPKTPKERIKVNVLVSGPELVSDTVRVTVFRQIRSRRGVWIAAKVNRQTGRDLENVILRRARGLRLAALNR